MVLNKQDGQDFGRMPIKSVKEDNTYSRQKPFISVIFIFFVWIFLKITLEFPYPSTDIFIFKDPGANLFFKHGFFAENLPYTSGPKIVHFMQGYLYSLLYGMWTLAVGFSFKKAILFDGLIDVSRFVLTYAYLYYSFFAAKKEKVVIPFLLLLPILFTVFDSDRSDVLATCFALINFILIVKFQQNNKKKFIVIVALSTAFCLFTAPMIGLFTLFISGVGLRRVSEKPRLLWMYLLILTVCLVLLLSPYLLFYPESLARLMNFYDKQYRGCGNSVASFLWIYWRHSFRTTPVSGFIHLFLWMQIGVNLIAYKASRRIGTLSNSLSLINALFIGTLFCVPFSYLLFPWHSNYLIFFSYLLTIYSISIFALLPKVKAKMLLAVFLFLNFIFPASLSAKNFLEALLRPKNQSSHFVAKEIYNSIPFGERVATIPTYYYILKKHYEPADMVYLSKNSLKSYRYILTGGCGTGKPGIAFMPFQFASKKALLKNYKIVFDSLNRTPTSLFKIRITRSAYGFGGILFKKKGLDF